MNLASAFDRPRLDRLLAGLEHVPLAVVVAGAGYGKTTAAHLFLRHARHPVAWVPLTLGDAEAAWEKLCAALAGPAPAAANALRLLGLPRGERAVARGVAALRANLRGPLVVVFDDYHLLPAASPLHAFLDALAFETVPGLRLLLLSRVRPPIRIATLVSKGHCLVVNAAALAFDEAETAGYLASRGLRLAPRAVARIRHDTRGWISAIYLLGEGVRQGNPAAGRADIAALFEENLLAPLPPEERTLLSRVSEFDRFPVEMAVEALGSARIGGLLERLVAENAFVTREDEDLYSFHPLFREVLAARRPHDDEQRSILRRAGLWYLRRADRRYPYTIDLFERAGCRDDLLAELDKPRPIRFYHDDVSAVLRLARSLPESIALRHPGAALQFVFFLFLYGTPADAVLARRLADRLERAVAAGRSPRRNRVLGEIKIIRAIVGQSSDVPGDLATAAHLLGGRDSCILRASHPFTFGLPMLLDCEFTAPGALDATVARCSQNAWERVADGFGRGSESLVRAEAALLRGDFASVEPAAHEAIAAAALKRQYFIVASACFTLLWTALRKGDVLRAERERAQLHEILPEALADPEVPKISIAMLRQAILLADGFFAVETGRRDEVPDALWEAEPSGRMLSGLGVPLALAARAAFRFGDPARAAALCLSLERLPVQSQVARLSALVTLALARERLDGPGAGREALATARREARQDGLEPLVDSFVAGAASVAAAEPPPVVSLSTREREVLTLAARGLAQKAIATKLGVGPTTVKAHLIHAYAKLGAKNRVQAIRVAEAKGVL